LQCCKIYFVAGIAGSFGAADHEDRKMEGNNARHVQAVNDKKIYSQ